MRAVMVWIGLILLIVLLMALFASPAFAQAADLHDATRTFDGTLDLIKQNAAYWNGRLRGYAERIFWYLTIIAMVVNFYPYAFKHDFSALLAEAVRFVFTIGIFYTLLLHSANISEAIINSFRQAGSTAAGAGSTLRPGEVFAMGLSLAKNVADVMTMNPVEAFIIAISTIIIGLSYVFLAAFMQLTLVESYLIINVSVLFMAFGALPFTRKYAVAMFNYAISIGAKLLVLHLLIGIAMQVSRQWAHGYKHDEASTLTLLGVAFACAYLSKTIADNVQGLLQGVSPGGGSTLGGMAAGFMAGAVGAPAMAAAVSQAMGGSSVGAAIKSGLSGFGGGGSSGPSMMNGGGGGGNSGGPQPRSGGGGFTPKPGTPPSSSGGAASPPPAAAASPAGNPAASMAHAAAAGAVKTVGVLSSLTVPGMEDAAKLSLATPQPPVEAGPVPETPENLIRPADANLKEELNNKGSKA